MSRILVTGGAGFLGSNLVAKLLEQGHEVDVIDNLWTSTPKSLKPFKQNPKFRYFEQDIVDPFPESIKPQLIYHLACPASPKQFPENPLGILDACYLGTRNVFQLALKYNARVLVTSTSEVYGDAEVIPQPETYWGNVNSFGPRSCYDEGKRVVEALAYAFHHQHQLDVRIARIFNAYGPNLLPNDGRVVSNFVAAALNGKPLIITGDGKSTRCFQYVSDCIQGLQLLMASEYIEPVNIGSDVETTVLELAVLVRDMVSKIMGREGVEIEYAPKPVDDPVRRKPDITRAREVLGWELQVGLEEGLGKIVDWYRQYLAEEEGIK